MTTPAEEISPAASAEPEPSAAEAAPVHASLSEADEAQRGRPSLLAGRSSTPLNDREVRAVAETFAGLDYEVPTRYEAGGRTSFRIETDEFGDRVGIVVYGPDIYPGTGIVDPNSALGMQAAAAHEISHFYRWRDHTELPELEYEYLDEALTSLDAAIRFSKLNPHHVRQLILDAMQRIQLHYRNLSKSSE